MVTLSTLWGAFTPLPPQKKQQSKSLHKSFVVGWDPVHKVDDQFLWCSYSFIFINDPLVAEDEMILVRAIDRSLLLWKRHPVRLLLLHSWLWLWDISHLPWIATETQSYNFSGGEMNILFFEGENNDQWQYSDGATYIEFEINCKISRIFHSTNFDGS